MKLNINNEKNAKDFDNNFLSMKNIESMSYFFSIKQKYNIITDIIQITINTFPLLAFMKKFQYWKCLGCRMPNSDNLESQLIITKINSYPYNKINNKSINQ